jgi:hypothetical protein
MDNSTSLEVLFLGSTDHVLPPRPRHDPVLSSSIHPENAQNSSWNSSVPLPRLQTNVTVPQICQLLDDQLKEPFEDKWQLYIPKLKSKRHNLAHYHSRAGKEKQQFSLWLLHSFPLIVCFPLIDKSDYKNCTICKCFRADPESTQPFSDQAFWQLLTVFLQLLNWNPAALKFTALKQDPWCLHIPWLEPVSCQSCSLHFLVLNFVFPTERWEHRHMCAINSEMLSHSADERMNSRIVTRWQLSGYTEACVIFYSPCQSTSYGQISPCQETVSKQLKPVSQLPL